MYTVTGVVNYRNVSDYNIIIICQPIRLWLNTEQAVVYVYSYYKDNSYYFIILQRHNHAYTLRVDATPVFNT